METGDLGELLMRELSGGCSEVMSGVTVCYCFPLHVFMWKT